MDKQTYQALGNLILEKEENCRELIERYKQLAKQHARQNEKEQEFYYLGMIAQLESRESWSFQIRDLLARLMVG